MAQLKNKGIEGVMEYLCDLLLLIYGRIFLEQAYQCYHGSRLYNLGIFGEGGDHHDDGY